MTTQPIIKWKALAKQINFKPTYYQDYIIQHLNRFNTVVGGKRVGKTLLAAFLGLYELMQANKTIWVVAPTYELASRVFKEILVWRNLYLSDILRVNIQTKEIRNVFANSILRMKSADVPVSLKGEGLDLVIGDEVGDWKKEIWERYIEPNLTQTRANGELGRSFLIGNANFYGSDWHKMCQTIAFNKFSYHLPTARTTVKGEIKSNNPNIVSEEELQRLYKEKDDKVWRQEYLAEFVPGQGVVFSNILECAKGIFEEPQRDRFYYIGLDLGRLQDFSVITVIDSRTWNIVYHERFKDIEYPFQKKRILATIHRFGRANTKTLVDQTGLGQPIVDDLHREGVNIEGFTLTNQSKKDIIEKLSILMQQRKITYPEIPELISELQVFSYRMTDSNRIQYGAPSGYHDDCVISLALATKELEGNPSRFNDPTMTQQELVKASSKFEINGLLSLEEKPIIKPYSVL